MKLRNIPNLPHRNKILGTFCGQVTKTILRLFGLQLRGGEDQTGGVLTLFRWLNFIGVYIGVKGF